MFNSAYKQYIFDNQFGWQVDRPVWVKIPFKAFGRDWKAGEEFNWQTQPCRKEDYPQMLKNIHLFFNLGKIHHDSARDCQNKVGDRLSELNKEQLMTLVRMVNDVVKKRCVTDKEFQDKKIKQSKIVEKQRGIIRAWTYRNHWALEEYTRIRDSILDKVNDKYPEQEPEETLTEK